MSKSASNAASAPQPDPPPDDPPAVDEADRLAASVLYAERRMRMLEELASIGMDLTRALHRRVLATEADPPAAGAQGVPPAEAAEAFAKLSRAVRLTLDLQARLEEKLRALRTGEATAREARREKHTLRDDDAEKERLAEASARVADQVEIAIAREAESEQDHNQRFYALVERLELDAAYEDVTDRPLRQVVEQLCSDLCLTPDWSGWTEEGWPRPPPVGPHARSYASPFHRPSPKPLLKRTLQRFSGLNFLELADQPP
jgi:hypothetical protein